MRKAAFIIGIIGAIGSLLLGFKWLSDLNSTLGLAGQQLAKGAGGKIAAEMSSMKTATYLLILCGISGLVFSISTLISKFKKEINAGALILSGVLPLFFSGNAIFGVPMVLAGILAFGAKPKNAPPQTAE